MADLANVKLSPERWKMLHDYVVSLNILRSGIADDPDKVIRLSVMIDVDGVTFLPAVYSQA